jgi:ferredoxin
VALLVTVDVERSEVYRIDYTPVKAAPEEDGMRVVVNRTLCESNAVCARLVPEIFVVDDDDRLQIKQEQPPEALRERVAHAVRRCPKLALSIVED